MQQIVKIYPACTEFIGMKLGLCFFSSFVGPHLFWRTYFPNSLDVANLEMSIEISPQTQD